MIGVWDDHDYGMHDGDSSHKDRDWFKAKYLDFLQEPQDSVRRNRRNDGIYTSYYLDAGKKVKLLLLDLHYSRTGDDDLGSSR